MTINRDLLIDFIREKKREYDLAVKDPSDVRSLVALAKSNAFAEVLNKIYDLSLGVCSKCGRDYMGTEDYPYTAEMGFCVGCDDIEHAGKEAEQGL